MVGMLAGRQTARHGRKGGSQTDRLKDCCFSSESSEHWPGVLTTWAIVGCCDSWDPHCQHLYYLTVFGGVRIETSKLS